MPEGPEIYIAAQFINNLCKQNLFAGNITKSPVSSKNPDVKWCGAPYTIRAQSRGKELKLVLETKHNDNKIRKQGIIILFRFGMSGSFKFDVENIHKHAHLNFYTQDKQKVLSFVDYRRFGRWEINSEWGSNRGPCVIQQYELFRDSVLQSLHRPVFNRPICEILLNQEYFNGIGNYLRAEILYRAKIRPFEEARTVLAALKDKPSTSNKSPDLLTLCNTLPWEVINLSGGKGYYSEAPEEGGESAFNAWLQCYTKPDMSSMVDSHKRTIWFSGPAGPLAPKDTKGRAKRKPAKQKTGKDPRTTTVGTVAHNKATRHAVKIKTTGSSKVHSEAVRQSVRQPRKRSVHTDSPVNRTSKRTRLLSTRSNSVNDLKLPPKRTKKTR